MVAGDGRLLVAHSVRELGPDSPRSTLCSSGSPHLACVPRPRSQGGRGGGGAPGGAARPRTPGADDRDVVPAEPLRRLAVLEPGLLLGRSFPNDRAELVERGLPGALVHAGLLAMRALLPLDVVRFVRGSSARVVSVHHPSRVRTRSSAAATATGSRCSPGRPSDPGALDRLAALGVDAGAVTDDPRGSSSSAVARARYDSRLMVRWVCSSARFLALAAAPPASAQTPPPTIAPGVLIGHTSVGGMTGAEARAAVQAAFDVKMSFYFQGSRLGGEAGEVRRLPAAPEGRGCGAAASAGEQVLLRLLPRRVGEELCRVPEPRLLPGAEELEGLPEQPEAGDHEGCLGPYGAAVGDAPEDHQRARPDALLSRSRDQAARAH